MSLQSKFVRLACRKWGRFLVGKFGKATKSFDVSVFNDIKFSRKVQWNIDNSNRKGDAKEFEL